MGHLGIFQMGKSLNLGQKKAHLDLEGILELKFPFSGA